MMKKLLTGVGLAALMISALHFLPSKDGLYHAMPITLGMFASKASYLVTYGGTLDDNTSTTSYSYSADIGTASADRIIVLAVHQSGGPSSKTVTATINGTSLGNIQQGTGRHHMGYAVVASGSGTQTIALTFSSAPARASISWWILTGYNTTHTDVQSTFNTSDLSRNITLTIPAGGVGIVTGTENATSAITPTNLATTDYNTVMGGSSNQKIGGRITSTQTVTFANVSSMAGFAFGL